MPGGDIRSTTRGRRLSFPTVAAPQAIFCRQRAEYSVTKGGGDSAKQSPYHAPCHQETCRGFWSNLRTGELRESRRGRNVGSARTFRPSPSWPFGSPSSLARAVKTAERMAVRSIYEVLVNAFESLCRVRNICQASGLKKSFSVSRKFFARRLAFFFARVPFEKTRVMQT